MANEARRCTVCGDLNQTVKESIYAFDLGKCPQCGNPEFSVILQENFEMAAVTEGKLGFKTKAKKPPAKTSMVTAASAPLPAAVVVPTGQLRSIRIDLLMPDPRNPRDEIDPNAAEIVELAATIVLVGLAQPILVRPSPAGMFFIIAGHRRYFGCKLAGLAVVDCMVRECTEEQWAILQIIENTQRKDLSPIEEANSFKNAMTTLEIGQTELAKRIGRTQSYISQRIGMLKFSPAILAWIKDEVLTFSQCRPLAVVSDLPETMAQFVAAMNVKLRYNVRSGVASNDDVDEALSEAIEETMRCMSGDYRGPKFIPTPELLLELDVREVHVDGDRESWAANTVLFDRLNNEAKAAIEAEKQPEGKGSPDSKKKNPGTISKAELKKKQEEAAAVLNKRLYRWYIAWLQGRILLAVQSGALDDEMRLIWLIAMSTAADGPTVPRLEMLATAAKTPFKEPVWDPGKRLEFVYDLDRGKISQTIQNWFEAWCLLPARTGGRDAHPTIIEILGRELGIDVAKQFKVTEEFLKLHSIEQLQMLGKEWCMTIGQKVGKADWIGMFIQNSESCVCPVELKNVKPVPLE
jgi:ParB/RepB/Spo0J family partition protein